MKRDPLRPVLGKGKSISRVSSRTVRNDLWYNIFQGLQLKTLTMRLSTIIQLKDSHMIFRFWLRFIFISYRKTPDGSSFFFLGITSEILCATVYFCFNYFGPIFIQFRLGNRPQKSNFCSTFIKDSVMETPKKVK